MAYNVLIVDDSQTMRAILTKTLKMADLDLGDIHTAVNGRDALEKLKAHWIDLVLTDLNMPEMSGLELVAAMSADELLHSIPVIVVSTDGSQLRVEELKNQGVRDFIRKPFTPEAIGQAVTKVMGEKDASSGE